MRQYRFLSTLMNCLTNVAWQRGYKLRARIFFKHDVARTVMLIEEEKKYCTDCYRDWTEAYLFSP